MKTASSSNLNRQQQVKVVIRLRPDDGQSRHSKCVYLSDKENELVVEAGNKKQIFVFDHVAHQHASQIDIYRMIGEQAVQTSLEGYNCCIFAYGQTGAGKTYSVMGSISDLQSDYYCESRGLLPRLLEDVFNWVKNHQSEKHSVVCSYMEIYNEQIFDLLATDKRIHNIREDFKRGVFVEGLSQKKVVTYKQAVDYVLEGQKTRKMAATSMNTESSRSHAIFTVMVETEIMEDDVLKVRKSKLNIVDLAGSERVKHTNVEGERLKEGCNINRSLHVLGNVINSLVESAKKKKHIPFRDSKLTHYLKDSLGGNSITKLLANIHCGKAYFGDTLSTLMFAKRAKILKMKVEVNQNLTQNFDNLRKEVKRLRQQLAQARYFKVETQRTERASFDQDFQLAFQRITENNNDFQVSPRNEILQNLQENEQHYKALIQVYEEHVKNCEGSCLNNKRRQSANMAGERKNLQKVNSALNGLVKNFPSFTKIYKQNLLLKEQRNKLSQSVNDEQQKEKKSGEQSTIMTIKQCEQDLSNCLTIEDVVKHYEGLIDEMKDKFNHCIEVMQKNYIELEHECKEKDKRLKDYLRRVDLPPDIQQLKNQNQYLHLNIMNLENQITKMQENQERHRLQKNMKRSPSRNSRILDREGEDADDEDLYAFVMDKIVEIKGEALKETQAADAQKREMQKIIDELQIQINKLSIQNSRMQLKQSRCRSQRQASGSKGQFKMGSESNMKKSLIQFLIPREQDFFLKKESNVMQSEIKSLQNIHSREICDIKEALNSKQNQLVQLKLRMDGMVGCDRRIEEEFGRNIDEIISDYREIVKKQMPTTKSVRNIHKYKEQDPLASRLDLKLQERIERKQIVDRSNKMKESKNKRQDFAASTKSVINAGKKGFFTSNK